MRDKIDSRWMGIKSGEEQAYALVLLDADVDTGEFMQVDYVSFTLLSTSTLNQLFKKLCTLVTYRR